MDSACVLGTEDLELDFLVLSQLGYQDGRIQGFDRVVLELFLLA